MKLVHYILSVLVIVLAAMAALTLVALDRPARTSNLVIISSNPEPVKVEDKEKPGLLVWKFDLTPGAKKTITFKFQVEYPKDKEVGGL